MKVAELMSTDVEFIEAGASVQEAATLMGEIEVGALPVGSAAELAGIVTDRDILYRLVARGRDPAAVTVGEIMSRPVVTCRPDEPIEAALDRMAANHLRRLPVMANDAVVGWLTLADISRHLLVGSDALQASLREMTEASAQTR
jgi:CBS domain-containing protein